MVYRNNNYTHTSELETWTQRTVKGGCKCLNPNNGGLEQLVTN